jgi:hypothetical protein
MESPLPGAGRDDRRGGPSKLARRQDRPSPGAGRRPLPGRERRLFVASLETAGSFFLSAHSSEQPLPAGNVGATRWVARGALHADQRRRVLWGLRARWAQGDAPRRPYMPCVQPRALHQRTSQHHRGTSCRGGSRTAPTTCHVASDPAMESPLPGAGRDDRRGGPSEGARRQHRPSPGATRRPLPARERRLFSAVQLQCANRHSVAPSHVDSSPSPWLGRGRG